MSSAETSPSVRKVKFANRRIAARLLVVIAGMLLVWYLPVTRLFILSWLEPLEEVSVRTLSDPNAITPNNVEDVHLLEHWGNGNFESIAWSPDGHTFAVATTFGIDLYDGKTFQLLQSIDIPVFRPYLPSFSTDPSLLAIVSNEHTIVLFDLKENRILHQWDMAERLSIVTFLKDATLICVTESNKVMRLSEDTWQLVTTLNDGFLSGVAFVPEKQALVAVYAESTQLVDPHNGRSRKLSFVVPYGGNLLLSNDVRVEVNRDLSQVSAYTGDTLVNQITMDNLFTQAIPSPKGDIMATLTMDPLSPWGRTVTLWKIPELKPVRDFQIPDASFDIVNELTFSPDGEKIAFLASPTEVKIFPASANDTHEITLSHQFAGIGDIGISSQGKIWTVNCTGRSVEIIERSSGALIDQWNFDKPACGQLLDDGISVAISEPYEKTRIFKVGKETAPVSIDAPCCRFFSADGSVGASSSEATSSGDPIVIGIWQQHFGLYQEWKYRREGYRAFQVAVSPTGQYVAASSTDKTHLYVRGVDTGRTYPSLGARLAFSPDEKFLTSAFRILDLETAHMIELEGSSDPVCAPESFSTPVFSSNGQVVAVETCGQLRFWRTSDGSLLAELDDPYGSYKLRFSPDGTFLVGSGIGNASVWGIKEITH